MSGDPRPILTSLDPASVPVNGESFNLALNGDKFTPTSVVMVNGTNRVTAYKSRTQLTAVIPAIDLVSVATKAVKVYTPPPHGGSSAIVNLPVTAVTPPLPTITSLTPSTAVAGSADLTVTVIGTNYDATVVVQWNAAALVTTFVSATQVTAVIPSADLANVSTAQVQVNKPGVGTSNAVAFTVTPTTPPPVNPIDALPPGQWMEVPGSNLGSVLPSPVPPGNPVNIIAAWSGGAYDTKRDRLIVWGGGHADYAGNEIYTFDLATLTWARTWGPSPNIPDFRTTCPDTYDDGNPVSRHTYDALQYVPTIDRFWIQGGSKACAPGSAGLDTWTFDFATGTWTRQADISQLMLGVMSDFDPATGNILVQFNPNFYSYDPVANVYTQLGNLPRSLSEDRVRTAAIDPNTRMFVVMGDGDFFAWDLRTNQYLQPVTTGATEIQSGRAPGFIYDPVSKKLIAWMGGASVYSLDTTTWVWTRIDPAAGNTVTPTSPPSAGTYGRFRYVPSKGVYIVVNGIWENVFVYRPASSTPPPSDQIPLPLKQWVALTAPQKWSTQGLPYEFKHVTPSYHPPSGRIYFVGGDYAGAIVGGSGGVDSYRQETWSLSLADRWALPDDAAAGWRLEYPYCGPVGQVQPKHPDYVGFPWDEKRGVFYMVPGVMESVSSGDCPGETPDKVNNPGFISGQMMTFNPTTKLWAVLGPPWNPDSQDTWMAVLDPVTDTMIQFTITMKVDSFDLKTNVWSIIAGIPDASIWKDYLAADIAGRVIYAIDGLRGNLWRYSIDTRGFENLGAIPGGPIGYTNLTYIAWDSKNKRLFWHKEGTDFFAYDPATATWETLSIATNVPGVNATGRLIVYDPGQNAILLYGGTVAPEPYLFLYRYA